MKTINFIYWMHNFRSSDLPTIFELLGDKQHFESKFNERYNQANGSVLGVVRFIMDLSNDNKQKVIDWVDENYDCGFGVNNQIPQPHPKVMELELKIEKAQQMIRDLRDDDAHVCPANDDITHACTCGEYDRVIDFLNSEHV